MPKLASSVETNTPRALDPPVRSKPRNNIRNTNQRFSCYFDTGGAGGAPKLGTNVDTNASKALMSQVSVCPVILPDDSSTV
jgi:hypothetical protein